MIYGTAHDTLNGHGPGLGARSSLGYLTPDPTPMPPPVSGMLQPRGTPGAIIDIPLSCGIDPNGNSWVMFSNQYFSTIGALQSYLNIYNNSGSAPFDINNIGASRGYAILQKAVGYAQQLVWNQNGHAGDYDYANRLMTLPMVIGALRTAGVPFTAYQPVPAPTISTPSPGTTQTIVVSSAPALVTSRAPGGDWVFSAPSAEDLHNMANTVTANDFVFYVNGIRHPISRVIFGYISNGVYHGLTVFSDLGVGYFKWAPSFSGTAEWANAGSENVFTPGPIFDVTLGNAPVSASAAAPSLAIPPGYQVLPSNATFVYPLYGHVPIFNDDGTTSFAGATPFYGLIVPDQLTGGVSSSQFIGLDKTKLSVGLYAYKLTDLGPITSPAGRQYQLSMLTIIDLATQKILGPFFQTAEGGGGGLLIANPIALASRIIVDVATWGSAEAARAGAKAAGVSQANIDLATEAGAAVAIAIATAGAAIAASAPAASAAGAAFPVAVDAGSATASLILPTTASVAAMDAAGATLLPASLSLIAPAAASVTVAEAITAGAAATAPEAAAVAPSSIAVPAAVKATAAGVTKAVEAAVISTGTTALSTEIKKLTGQLPGVKPPSQMISMPAAAAAPVDAGSSKLLTWGLGALAALAVFKKH